MKKIYLFLTLCLGIGGQGWSHEAPVPSNQMRWTVDQGHLNVRLHADAAWWGLNVFGDLTPPPTRWPIFFQKAAKDYFDQHFAIRGDGTRLTSQLVSCRFTQELWQYYSGAYLELEFSYMLPPSIKTISGTATFYKEEEEGRHETRLKIDGAPDQSLLLTLDHPDFSFSFARIVRSPARRSRDAFVKGLSVWRTAPWLVLVFAGFQLQLRTRARGSFYYGGIVGAAAAMDTLFLAICPIASGAFWLGCFICLLAIAVAVETGARLYRRQLTRVSESQAEHLFTSQIRFVSLLLTGMALLFIFQSFPKTA